MRRGRFLLARCPSAGFRRISDMSFHRHGWWHALAERARHPAKQHSPVSCTPTRRAAHRARRIDVSNEPRIDGVLGTSVFCRLAHAGGWCTKALILRARVQRWICRCCNWSDAPLHSSEPSRNKDQNQNQPKPEPGPKTRRERPIDIRQSRLAAQLLRSCTPLDRLPGMP
ncbi:hypothetical protein XACM_1767 [Xanthomonas euvesicatoria pv. citrumelo F1]|nr:hypothetical protein XACM_1767 [Xanthomonas euvesicatoria pv. citrumelo F1]